MLIGIVLKQIWGARRLYGFSPKKVHSVLPAFILSDDKDRYLEQIEQTSKWPKSYDPCFKSPASGFVQKFKKVSNIFRYPPVFWLAVADNHDEIDLCNPVIPHHLKWVYYLLTLLETVNTCVRQCNVAGVKL